MPKDRLFPPDERLEEGRIGERMKAMPVWRKDSVEKRQRGPVVGCINNCLIYKVKTVTLLTSYLVCLFVSQFFTSFYSSKSRKWQPDSVLSPDTTVVAPRPGATFFFGHSIGALSLVTKFR